MTAAARSSAPGELTVRVTSKQSSAVFSDVNAGTCAWAADAVDFMNGYGLIQGADASTFNWRGSMTRGDLILILYRSAGSSRRFPEEASRSRTFRNRITPMTRSSGPGKRRCGRRERDGILHEAGRHARAAGLPFSTGFPENPPCPASRAAIRMPPMSAPTLSMRCAGLSAAAISREAARS